MKNIKTFEDFNNNEIRIEKIKQIDNEGVIDVLYSGFSHLIGSKQELLDKIRPRLNNNLSVCLKLNNNIIGVYLLNEKSINDFIESINKDVVSDFRKNDTKISLDEELSDNGLQGIAFSILPEFINMGYGKLLKEYTYGLGYDYIWGVQDKNLNNIEYWVKSRKIFAESPNRYATYIKIKK